jgi:phosphatidylinositol alpha-mannosyltransferase
MVTTFHARPPAWVMKSRRLIPRSWFRAAVLTAVSAEAAQLASVLGEVEIIPNGLHCAGYVVDVPRQLERVVFLGRDEPRKGLRVLLQAWPRIMALHPQAELLVIGSSGDVAGTQGLRYAGRVTEDEKRRLLSTAAVLAAPNLGGESFGIAVAEGMAAGCAVVASDIPAFRALTGDTAVLVSPGDPAALAAALSNLLGNQVELERRALAGRARAGQFDWSLVLPAYLRCYERAAGAAAGLG